MALQGVAGNTAHQLFGKDSSVLTHSVEGGIADVTESTEKDMFKKQKPEVDGDGMEVEVAPFEVTFTTKRKKDRKIPLRDFLMPEYKEGRIRRDRTGDTTMTDVNDAVPPSHLPVDQQTGRERLLDKCTAWFKDHPSYTVKQTLDNIIQNKLVVPVTRKTLCDSPYLKWLTTPDQVIEILEEAKQNAINGVESLPFREGFDEKFIGPSRPLKRKRFHPDSNVRD
jgi:hypothetical protein